MTNQNTAYLFAFYGLFMLTGALATYFFMNTLNYSILISTVVTGILALFAGHFMNLNKKWAFIMGLLQTVLSIPVFGWLSIVTFTKLTELLHQDQALFQESVKASLLIIPLFMLTVFVMIIQVKHVRRNLGEMK